MEQRILCILVGYVFGLFQTAYFYGKSKGIDIRKEGSGNAGATNTLRVLGTKAAFIVLFGDALKCAAGMLLVKYFVAPANPDLTYVYMLYSAAGSIIGHNFPFYMSFKGGKGIACTAGLVACFHWSLFVELLTVFIVAYASTMYVSLGSIMVYVFFVILAIVEGQLGVFGVSQAALNEMYIIIFFLACMAIFQHRANVKRLLKGEERKTYLTKKNQK